MRKLQLFIMISFIVIVVCFGGFLYYENMVLDTTPPVITCSETTLTCSAKADEAELLSNVTAYDDVDGDLTDEIIIEGISQLITKSAAKITYVVFDSSNNVGRLSRIVEYTDYEKPKFQVTKPLIFAKAGSISILDRVGAQDSIDGDISKSVRVTAQNVDATTEGEYSITLQVTNSMGDTSILPLTLIVNSASVRRPLIQLSTYLDYVDLWSDFDPMSYIERVTDSKGAVKNVKDVTVASDVDTNKVGIYEVRYSYSSGGNDYVTILTVVVE